MAAYAAICCASSQSAITVGSRRTVPLMRKLGMRPALTPAYAVFLPSLSIVANSGTVMASRIARRRPTMESGFVGFFGVELMELGTLVSRAR